MSEDDFYDGDAPILGNDSTGQNPFLGEAWTPLVDVLEALLNSLNHHDYVLRVQVLGRAYGNFIDSSPYFQFMRYPGDGMLAELSVNNLKPALGYNQFEQMMFMRWVPPIDGNPNFHRQFDEGSSKRRIAEIVLEALTTVYSIESHDWFKFETYGHTEKVTELNRLWRFTDQPYFSLPGQNAEFIDDRFLYRD